MIELQITIREVSGQDAYVPDHSGYKDKVAFYDIDRPIDEVKAIIWGQLEEMFPGVFAEPA